VADFIGSANLFPGRVTSVSRTEMRVDVVGGPLVVGPGDFAVGDDCLVAIRPEHIEIRSTDRDNDPNDREGVVLAAAFVGQSVDYEIQVQTVTVRCRTPAAIRLPSGSTVKLRLVASRCIALPTTRGRQPGLRIS
jgi:ABC-type Fe3+/spermidine/putrescine transport system ATPase subunit